MPSTATCFPRPQFFLSHLSTNLPGILSVIRTAPSTWLAFLSQSLEENIGVRCLYKALIVVEVSRNVTTYTWGTCPGMDSIGKGFFPQPHVPTLQQCFDTSLWFPLFPPSNCCPDASGMTEGWQQLSCEQESMDSPGPI